MEPGVLPLELQWMEYEGENDEATGEGCEVKAVGNALQGRRYSIGSTPPTLPVPMLPRLLLPHNRRVNHHLHKEYPDLNAISMHYTEVGVQRSPASAKH